jgi:hypothetical protein
MGSFLRNLALSRRLLEVTMIGCLLATTVRATAAEADKQVLDAFRRDVQPLLKQFCFECHAGPIKKKKDPVRLDRLDPDMIKGPHAETWHDVLSQLNRGEMPPEDEPQPSAAQRQKIVDWVTAQLKRAAEVRRNTGGHVVLRRLTRYEYRNTMRDLLGVDLDFAQNLPPEPNSVDGFKNNGASLGISPLQIEYYLKAARDALAKAIVTGEKPKVIKFDNKKAKKNEKAKKNQKKKKKNKKRVKSTSRLVRNEQFVVNLNEFPRQGQFRIRVWARAEMPKGAGYPRMQVSIGLKSDTKSPEEAVSQLDITATDKAEAYDFFGRIEDFPLPGHNPKFPGMLLLVRNVYTVQNRKAKKVKGKSSNPVIHVASIEFEGPLLDNWPPTSHTRILLKRNATDSDGQYARKVLARFMERAYRRPVEQREVETIGRFFDKIRPASPSLEEAIRETLARVLISPDFLYLVEPAGTPEKRTPLSDFELASRLSYFLWSTMPDEPLLALARGGKLRQAKVLEQQVRRMIADKRSWNFVRNYTNQWLNLSGLERVAVNPQYYPRFDNRLKDDMRGETQHFFAEILYKDLSYMNLIDADFTMLNRRLAEHYGMPGPRGNQFERVAIKAEHHRGGLLAQGSMLLSNSTGEDSHPIKRAVWLLDRLLDDPPAPPPPDVPELDKKNADLAGLSVRKQLEMHRKKDACNSCHRGIDPWGIPLENYDATGRWRETIRGAIRKKKNKKLPPVEAESVLPGGHKISGPQSLKKHLLSNEKDRLARACVKKLLSYSLGRSIELGDRQAVEMLTKKFTQRKYRLSDLLVEIVKSEPFQTK